MKRSLAISMVLMMVCGLALSADAQQRQRGPGALPGLLNKADANEDGKITFKELKAVAPKMTEERFKRMDQDGDGVLTKKDRPKPGELLKKADKNEDGKITFKELKTVAPKMTQEKFNHMDRNKDGVISKEDRPEGQGRPRGRKPDGKGLLKKADADNDGKITLEELKAVAPKMTQERFKKMDRNDDGVLTADEIKKRQGQHRRDRGADSKTKSPKKDKKPKS